jgi:hypothetical protein
MKLLQPVAWNTAASVVPSMTMNAGKARVQNGSILVDEPTDLPDGMVLLVPVDADELDNDERAALHCAIDRGLEDVEAGRVISEDALWEMLLEKRGS